MPTEELSTTSQPEAESSAPKSVESEPKKLRGCLARLFMAALGLVALPLTMAPLFGLLWLGGTWGSLGTLFSAFLYSSGVGALLGLLFPAQMSDVYFEFLWPWIAKTFLKLVGGLMQLFD